MLKFISLPLLACLLFACGTEEPTPTKPNYTILESSVKRDRLVSDINALIKNGIAERIFAVPEKYVLKIADIQLSTTPPHRKLLRIESEEECQGQTCMLVMFFEEGDKNTITEIIFGYDLTIQPQVTLGHHDFTLKAYGEEQYWRWLLDPDQGDRYDINGTRPINTP